MSRRTLHRLRSWRPRGIAKLAARSRARTRWPVTLAPDPRDQPRRAPATHADAARVAGFELAGVAAILITVFATVGLRVPAARSTPEGHDRGGAALTTAARIDYAAIDTGTTQHARRTDSVHRTARTEAGKLPQDSLAKRRDAAAQAPHDLPQDSLTSRRGGAARARQKPRDSLKAHRAPPTSTVVP